MQEFNGVESVYNSTATHEKKEEKKEKKRNKDERGAESEEGRSEREMKGEEDEEEEEHGDDQWIRMKRRRREGREMRKGEMGMVPGRESEQVDEDATGWVEVRRSTRRRVVQEGHEDEGGKSCKTVQIFVKMDGSRTITTDVAQKGKSQ